MRRTPLSPVFIFIFIFVFMLAGLAAAEQSAQSRSSGSSTHPSTVFVPAETLVLQGIRTAAESSEALTTPEVEQLIQDKISSEPELAKDHLIVTTNDQAVTLSGNVGRKTQHDLALRIAGSYAGNRQLSDRIIVRSSSQLRSSKMSLETP